MVGGWTRLAKIIKPNNSKDGLVLKFCTKSFFLIDGAKKLCGKQLNVVPPAHDIPRQISFDDISELTKNKFCATLSCNDNIDDIYEFSNRYLLCSTYELKNALGDNYNLFFQENNLVGASVKDLNLGNIGKIVEVVPTPAHDNLVIAGKGGEFAVPFVDEYVIERSSDEVVVNVPQSLIDLNKE